MTQNDDGTRAAGVFLAVPSHITHRQLAQALSMLGFAPGVVESLTLHAPRGTEGQVTATVRYVDRRDAVRREALASITVPVWASESGPTMRS